MKRHSNSIRFFRTAFFKVTIIILFTACMLEGDIETLRENAGLSSLPLPPPTVISSSLHHTVAVRENGSLWTWGNNEYGQLGDGTRTNRATPTRIGTATNWSTVAAGANHTVAIRTDGTLWAWGFNGSGRLGDGTTFNRNAPVRIGTASNWISVSAGGLHTVATREDGSLWAWGLNHLDEEPIFRGGTAHYRWSNMIPDPIQIGADNNWAFVSAGDTYTMVIGTDGSICVWEGWSVTREGEDEYGDSTESWILIGYESLQD